MKPLLPACVLVTLVTVTQTASVEDRFFDSNGVRIHYVEQGTGEPVVLLHGLGGTLRDWQDAGVLQGLAADHHVIALDARGHGQTGKPHDPKQYGREMAMDVVRLLDRLAIRQAHIVGYSLGAAITSQLLVLHPERVLTATLVAGGGRLNWTAENDRVAEQTASEIEKDCVSRTLFDTLAPRDRPKASDEEFKKRSDACFADPSRDRYAIAALTRSRRDQVILPAQVASLTVPTSGIVGSLDRAGLEGLQELKKVRPGVTLVVIDGATHGGERGILRPPQFLSAVRTFIDSHRTTSPPSRR